ncbi:MAG: MobA/MobL protein [Lachnoclostridium sp.]|nr:MobA/MobL protein [Lachnoclostridium sp.]
MANFHLSAQIISRSEGRSAIAAAAYRSASKIESEWDGLTYDFTRKNWVVHSEVLTPAYVPEQFKDRSTLWNSVEQAEKSSNAQLAREIEIGLPKELVLETQIALVREYILENFICNGMCADFSIHHPPITNGKGIPVDKDGTPTNDLSKMIFRNCHVHIMLTMRPIDENGQWESKSEKAYTCRRDNLQMNIPARFIAQAEAEGWKKLYYYYQGKRKVKMTAEEAEEKGLKRVNKYPATVKMLNPSIQQWSSKDTLKRWRENWAVTCNRVLEENGIDTRIDHRSYAEQGVARIAGVHMGVQAFQMEKKGIRTDRGDLNRQIQEDNRFLYKLEVELKQLENKERERMKHIASRLEGIRAQAIVTAYQQLALSEEAVSEQEQKRTALEKARATAEATEQLLATIEALGHVIAEAQRQLEKTNPFQIQKRKLLKEEIVENEKHLQVLKQRLAEVKHISQKEKGKATINFGVYEEKQKRIQKLQELQFSLYREFHMLVQTNQTLTKELKDLVRGKRPAYDSLVESKLKDHYQEGYNVSLLKQARTKAPDLLGSGPESLHRDLSYKRKIL